MKNIIYTIGYSKFTIDTFIQTIKKYGINVVADVRSHPYSRFKPEFNRESLIQFLKKEGIKYLFLGNECGARTKSTECYVNGKADYILISKTDIFINGIERIKKGSEKYHIVLMCAEADPITCHRTILVSRNLQTHNIKIIHILYNGKTEDNKDTEIRLAEKFNFQINQLSIPGFGKSTRDMIEDAYDKQGEKIAYSIDTGSTEEQYLKGGYG